jgi:uncharacterized phiE125 gp8 family phage protein
MQVEITGQTVVLDDIVSVADLKAYMRVTHTAEDTLISALRLAAIAYIEEHCNIKLGTYNMRGYLPGFYNAYFPMGPVQAVTEVKYQTTEDKTLQQPDDAGHDQLVHRPHQPTVAHRLPRLTEHLRVRFDAGGHHL